LVYLSVKDEDELNYWKQHLEWERIEYSEFREPDIGNKLTTIACLSDGKIFKRLKLLN
jgi:hypothetical protein